MVADAKQVSFSGPGWNVGPFHGQGDAVGRDKCQDYEIKPSLRGEILAELSKSEIKELCIENIKMWLL